MGKVSFNREFCRTAVVVPTSNLVARNKYRELLGLFVVGTVEKIEKRKHEGKLEDFSFSESTQLFHYISR